MATEQQIRDSKKGRRIAGDFQAVLGRDPSLTELQQYSTYKRHDLIRPMLATTPEAAKKKVDASKYGAGAVDPASLQTQRQKDMYAQYTAAGKTPNAYEFNVWVNSEQAPSALKADLAGQIKHEWLPSNDKQFKAAGADKYTGGYLEASIYSPDAIKTMGGKFTAAGYHGGELVFLPTGTMGGSDWRNVVKDAGGGYAGYMAEGKDPGGLIERVLGADISAKIASWVPRPLAAYVDSMTLGLGSGLLLGRAGMEKTQGFYNGLGLGSVNEKILPAIYKTEASVAAGVATGGNPAAIAGAAASYDLAQAEMYSGAGAHVNWRDAVTRAGEDAAVSYAGASIAQWGGGLNADVVAAQNSGMPEIAHAATVSAQYRAAEAAAAQAGLSGSLAYSHTHDLGQAALSAGTTLAGQAIGGDTYTRAGAGAALAYATTPGKYRAQAVASSLVSSVGSGGSDWSKKAQWGGPFRPVFSGDRATSADFSTVKTWRNMVNTYGEDWANR